MIVKAAVAATLLACGSTAAMAQEACELHVFPTLEGQAQSTGWLSGLGVIGAVADAAGH